MPAPFAPLDPNLANSISNAAAAANQRFANNGSDYRFETQIPNDTAFSNENERNNWASNYLNFVQAPFSPPSAPSPSAPVTPAPSPSFAQRVYEAVKPILQSAITPPVAPPPVLRQLFPNLNLPSFPPPPPSFPSPFSPAPQVPIPPHIRQILESFKNSRPMAY